MFEILAAASANDVVGIGLLLTAFGFGLRHGIDWDHIAAITDIASSQEDARRSLGYSTLYAVGHGAVVFVIGVVVIVFAEQLPAAIDQMMERVVGVTLILLGVYVVVALFREGRDFRMRSRWMLVFAGVRRTHRWLSQRLGKPVEVVHEHDHPADEAHDEHHVSPSDAATSSRSAVIAPPRTHRHRHRHTRPASDDAFLQYGRATSLGVGMIHGVGAETPTQVLLFLTAAGVGGTGAGVLLLTVFLLGLFASNTAIAVAATLGFLSSSKNFVFYAALSAVTAVSSLVIGVVFLLGRGSVLPSFFAG